MTRWRTCDRLYGYRTYIYVCMFAFTYIYIPLLLMSITFGMRNSSRLLHSIFGKAKLSIEIKFLHDCNIKNIGMYSSNETPWWVLMYLFGYCYDLYRHLHGMCEILHLHLNSRNPCCPTRCRYDRQWMEYQGTLRSITNVTERTVCIALA